MGQVWTAAKTLGAWLFKSEAGKAAVGTAAGVAAGAAASNAMTPAPKMPDIPEIKTNPAAVETQVNAATSAREARRKNALRQGLAATMRAGQLGKLNTQRATLTGSTGKKTLLGQ